jgi:hypothetical protein
MSSESWTVLGAESVEDVLAIAGFLLGIDALRVNLRFFVGAAPSSAAKEAEAAPLVEVDVVGAI